jgi:hypothetical protein
MFRFAKSFYASARCDNDCSHLRICTVMVFYLCTLWLLQCKINQVLTEKWIIKKDRLRVSLLDQECHVPAQH